MYFIFIVTLATYYLLHMNIISLQFTCHFVLKNFIKDFTPFYLFYFVGQKGLATLTHFI